MPKVSWVMKVVLRCIGHSAICAVYLLFGHLAIYDGLVKAQGNAAAELLIIPVEPFENQPFISSCLDRAESSGCYQVNLQLEQEFDIRYADATREMMSRSNTGQMNIRRQGGVVEITIPVAGGAVEIIHPELDELVMEHTFPANASGSQHYFRVDIHLRSPVGGGISGMVLGSNERSVRRGRDAGEPFTENTQTRLQIDEPEIPGEVHEESDAGIFSRFFGISQHDETASILQVAEDRTFEDHHLFPKVNPINPNLVAYEYRGNIEIVDKSRNNMNIFIIGCRETMNQLTEFDTLFRNIERSDYTPEHHYFDCAYFDWRPVLDYRGNYWYAFTSDVDRALRVGYINQEMNCYDVDVVFSEILTVNCSFYDVISTGYERFTRPKWSPDGQRILFNRGNSLQLTSPLFDHIRKKNFSGITSRELARYAWYPAWSHDGRYIAYEESPGGHDAGEMYIMDMNHPDGAGSPGSIRNIRDYIIQTRAAPSVSRYRPNWSASGNYLTYLVPSAIDERWGVKVMQIERDRQGALENLVSITAGQASVFVRNVFRSPHGLPDGFAVTTFRAATGETLEGLLVIAADQDLNNPVRIYPVDARHILSGGVAFARDLSREPGIGTVQNDMVDVIYDGRTTHISYVSQTGGSLRLQHMMIGDGRLTNRWNKPADSNYSLPRELNRNHAMLRSALFPGLGQFYKGETGKGLFFSGISVTGATGLALMIYRYNNERASLRELENRLEVIDAAWDMNGTVSGIEAHYHAKAALYEKINQTDKNLSVTKGFTIATAAILGVAYTYNLYDSRKGFPLWKGRDGTYHRLAIRPDMIDTNLQNNHGAGITLAFQLN